jgi:hypothetical protein
MTQKEKLRIMVKQMIAESMSPRIAAIYEAGDIAANEAKKVKIDQEAKKIDSVKKLIEKVNLSQYIGDKLAEKVMQEMDKSIQEYESARLELEEKMSGEKPNKKDKKKGAKSDKKDEKPEEKDEVLETEESVEEVAIDSTQL